jgi:hypothetical protein
MNEYQRRLRHLWTERREGNRLAALRCTVCGHEVAIDTAAADARAAVARARGQAGDHMRAAHPEWVAAAGVGPKARPNSRERRQMRARMQMQERT